MRAYLFLGETGGVHGTVGQIGMVSPEPGKRLVQHHR
jgi:hypothetical protein